MITVTNRKNTVTDHFGSFLLGLCLGVSLGVFAVILFLLFISTVTINGKPWV